MNALQRTMVACALPFALVATAQAQADNYPSHPVTLVVPYEAGSMVDTTVRLLAQQLSEKFKQSFIVENRTGGNGQVAMNHLLNAKPDGYTLMADTPASAINPSVYAVRYNPTTDLVPVAQLMALPFVLGYSNSLPAKNYQEFVALAKAHPEKINVSSGGTSTRLAGELFGLRAGLKLQNVNYKGASTAIMAVLNSECQLTAFDVANMAPQITAGKMRGLLIASDKRSPALPDVPTAEEVGLKDFKVSTWFGMFAPKGTPKAVVDKLNASMREAFETPKYRAYIDSRGATVTPLTADEFGQFFQSEIVLWRNVIQDANVKFD